MLQVKSQPAHGSATAVPVRLASAGDAEVLLQSMELLAEFEGYRDRFRVDTKELLARGLAAGEGQQFKAFVADRASGGLSGYAVVLEILFTFDLRPTWILKELFVAEDSRGQQVGTALMEAVIAHARTRGCGRLQWLVLPQNERAKRFYRKHGGNIDSNWESWVLPL
jgi:GNAT superfamily N-acetyltransferase